MRSAMKWVGTGVAVAGISSLIACSLLVPYDELQCATSADCTARGPAFASAQCVANVCQMPKEARVPSDAGAPSEAGDASGPWGCVSQPSAAINTSPQLDIQFVGYSSLGSFTYTGNMDGGNDLTLAQYTPLPGVSVEACTADDPGCMAPATVPVVTDDAGLAVLNVPGNFNGFYYLTKMDFAPELFFPATHLLASDQKVHYPVTMLSNDSLNSLASAFGIMSGAADGGSQGILLVTQFDCQDRHGADVSITTSPSGGVTLYTTNGVPSNGATTTSTDGQAAILDLPNGPVTVTAALQGANPQVVAKTNVILRAGAITWVFMRPRTH